MTKILQFFRIYVYTILFTYGYVQYVSDQNGYHTHKRTNCNIMYQHSDVTRLRCTLFNKKTYFGRISEAEMGGGGAQRPVLCINELKKTGARSARARTRGQNH